MGWNPLLRKLRDILVDLYEVDDGRRVADDAGLDRSVMRGPSRNAWHSLLLAAERQGRIAALLQVVLEDYPSHPTLAHVAAVLQRSSSPAATAVRDDTDGTLYITSDLFAVTFPIRAKLDAPAGVCLDALLSELHLPREFQHGSRLGVRFDYTLVMNNALLVRASSLASQGVSAGATLRLETRMEIVAAALPTDGVLSTLRFRHGEISALAFRDARRELLNVLREIGIVDD
jgi:hypothetical protein